jgi:hypothetical protein
MAQLELSASKLLLLNTIPPPTPEAPMKPYAPLAFFVLLLSGTSLDTAFAQPSKPTHPMVKSKSSDVSGVDKITPKEPDDKTTKNGSGWNGSYVGVTAGTSFGATAGTNLVIPLGSDDEK